MQGALCHSTVDNSRPELCAGQISPNPGTGCIGRRLDGWANRDLNVGAIVALAPDLSVVANLLQTDQATVRNVRTGDHSVSHLPRIECLSIHKQLGIEFSGSP